MSYELHCTKKKETDNAILVVDEDGLAVWFPLSQVISMHFNVTTGVGSIIVPDWLATGRGYL